ncbi:MAG: TolC family protein [Armatimonadota bacterium]
MKRTRISVLILAALLGLAVPLCAQETPVPLSLEECIQIAQQHQVDVLTGANAVAGAAARTTQARSGYFPQVSIQSTPLVASGATGGGISAKDGTSISLSQSIYDGGLREIQVKQARFGEQQNSASLARTRQTVTFTVTRAYYEALRAQRLAEVANTQVDYVQGQYDLVRARVEAGDAAQVDELPVQAQLANARVQRLAANNSVRTTLIALQNAMGLSTQPGFAIRDVEVVRSIDMQSQEGYIAQALTNRPDVQAQSAAVGSAQAALKAAKLQTQPRIIASGQYGVRLDGATSSDWSVSAGLAYDLFDGGKNRAAAAEQKTSLASAQERAKQLAKDIAADVQEAYLNLANAQERMAASAVSLAAAQRNFEAQNARYKEGLAVPLDLLNAQVALATAQSDAVQARYDYYTAVAQLEYATGK